VNALSQRVPVNQLLKCRQGLRVAAPAEFRLQQALGDQHPHVLEPTRDQPDGGLIGEVAEGGSPPQVERFGERCRGHIEASIVEGDTALLGEALEVVQIEAARRHAQDVARAAGRDRVSAQCLAQVRDRALDHVRGTRGSGLAPELVDQPVSGHDRVRLGEQQDQHGTLACSAELYGPTIELCLERPEEAVLRGQLFLPAEDAVHSKPGPVECASRRCLDHATLKGMTTQAGDYTVRRIDEMDAGFAGHFMRARSSLGVTSFGLSILELGPNFAGYPEHSHEIDRQEEVFVVLDGSATLMIDGDQLELDRDTLIRVGWECRRKVIAGPEGVRFLVIGGCPSQAYAPPPFSELGAPDSAERAGPAPA
jgi:mannose-6-phosphate isomerase-like protein (cupin superfamily)